MIELVIHELLKAWPTTGGLCAVLALLCLRQAFGCVQRYIEKLPEIIRARTAQQVALSKLATSSKRQGK